jgi:hypothetical protein
MHEEMSLIKEMKQRFWIDMHRTARTAQVLALLFTVIFAISNVSTIQSTFVPELKSKSMISIDLPSLKREWPIRIVFVGYNRSYINTTKLFEQLPKSSTIEYEDQTVAHSADYTVRFAGDVYYNNTLSLLRNNSISGIDIGSKINVQKLIENRDGISSDTNFFEPLDGTRINATAVEMWYDQHPFVQSVSSGFVIYILNTTEYASELPFEEHWYEYDYENPDTGVPEYYFDSFRTNPPSGMQMNAFGGRNNKFIIDPFAYQWYLKYARYWYNDSLAIGDSWPVYMLTNFSEVLQGLDLSSPNDVNSLTDYFGEYCSDVVETLFLPGSEENGRYLAPRNLESTLAPPNVSIDIYSIDRDIRSYTWIANGDFISSQLSNLLPFRDISFSLVYNNLDDVSSLNQSFWSNAHTNASGVYFNGTSFNMVNSIDPLHLNIFLGEHLTLTTINGSNTFLVQHSSGIICADYLDISDGTVNFGLSERILQVIGEIIGIRNAIHSNLFISDFSRGLMGFLTRVGHYSLFEKSASWRMFLDQFEMEIRQQFIANLSSLPETLPSKTSGAISNALLRFGYVSNDLTNHKPLSAYNMLLSMNNWTRRIISSLTDSLRPEIFGWNFTHPANSFASFPVWANVSETGSGIENVSFVVTRNNYVSKHLLHYNGSLFTAQIPALRLNATFEVYIEAYDWATNRAESYSVVLDLRPTGPPPLDPWATAPIVTLGSGAVLMFVVILALIYDKRKNN